MILMIYSAGSNARFGGQIKSLSPINFTLSVLQHNVYLALDHVSHVFIVIQKGDRQWYPDFNHPKVEYLEIESGLGSGHAVLKSLEICPIRHEEVCVMWGDSILADAEILKELKTSDKDENFVFPVFWTRDPYVEFKTFVVGHSEVRAQSVCYSRLGQTSDAGYTDRCVFKADFEHLYSALLAIHTAYWNGDHYETPTNDLEFLSVVNYLYNIGYAATVYATQHQVFSFNTQQELVDAIANFKTLTQVP